MDASPHDQSAEPTASLPKDALRRLESWLGLPPSDRAELLEGRIVYKTMASIEHGGAAMAIAEQIGRLQGPVADGGGGWWLSQEVDLFLSGQGLRPDLVGWRIDRHPRPPEKVNIGTRHLGVYVAPPDWVCEVLSGSTRARDEVDGIKWRAYHEVGVGHYWLVDLDRQQITVYERGVQQFEAVDVAGPTANKHLPPFVSVEMMARRVFLLASHSRQTAT